MHSSQEEMSDEEMGEDELDEEMGEEDMKDLSLGEEGESFYEDDEGAES